MYSMLLIVHVTGAVLTGVVSCIALTIVVAERAEYYRVLALALSSLAAFEVLSGVVLSVLSPGVTAVSLCANIALYLSFVAVVELIISVSMRKRSREFPTSPVLAPICGSLAALGVVMVLGI